MTQNSTISLNGEWQLINSSHNRIRPQTRSEPMLKKAICNCQALFLNTDRGVRRKTI